MKSADSRSAKSYILTRLLIFALSDLDLPNKQDSDFLNKQKNGNLTTSIHTFHD